MEACQPWRGTKQKKMNRSNRKAAHHAGNLHGERLFGAALTPLDVGAFIIIVGASSCTGSAFAKHQRTALAAEQLSGQQIFFVCLATGRGTLVLMQRSIDAG